MGPEIDWGWSALQKLVDLERQVDELLREKRERDANSAAAAAQAAAQNDTLADKIEENVGDWYHQNGLR